MTTLVIMTAFVIADPMRWSFDSDSPGRLPTGWTAAVGEWEVVGADGANRVLAQRAKNANPVFNLVLADTVRLRDLDLSVRLRSVAGELDQGGGLVWRARDEKNYYIARYNPLEANFRVYKVVDGRRTQLQTQEEIEEIEGWRTLRVTMVGDLIQCWLDGKKLLETRDSTFSDAGRIGLWTKADAQTQFDDLTAAVP